MKVTQKQPRGMKCASYKCVPAKVGKSAGCPTGQVKRCSSFGR